MVILRTRSENLGRRRPGAPSPMDRFSSECYENGLKDSTPLALPIYDGNSSNSSLGSFTSRDHDSPNATRLSSRRRYPVSSNSSLPLFNSSNNSLHSGSDRSLEPKPRSSSKARRISRSNSGSSAGSNSLMRASEQRFRILQHFDTIEVLQMVLLFVIVILVIRLHSGADFTAESLQRLRQQESLGLLQLHKIEKTSLSLHEDLRGRLKEAGILQEHENDSLEPQHRQLERMTSEIDNQVISLQKLIQSAAKQEIINAYGEGPVKVVIELDFGEAGEAVAKETSPDLSATQISVALFPQTPHSVWTLLDQVGRFLWDGAELKWDTTSNMLLFHPTKADDSTKNGGLEFVEHHPSNPKMNPGMHHGPWTVGLRESVDENGEAASENPLELFINLADNTGTQRHETCIGKILDGFYALQRLLEATQMRDGKAVTQIKVKTITAMHITNHEMNQVF